MSLGEEIAAEGTVRPSSPVYAETASWDVKGDEGAFTLPPGAQLGDLEALMRERGIDPADWHVERVTVNEWDALAHGGGVDGEPRVVKLRQLKVHLRNRRMAVGPAVEVKQRHRPLKRSTRAKDKPLLVAVLADQHAPYHDQELHGVVLRWLAEVKPDELVLAGDGGDFPTISRHRDRLNWNASVQEVVQAQYGLYSDYRDAAPRARIRKLRGNHDYRLESELMNRAERMAFVRPADRAGEQPEHHLYSVRRLLHLEQLAIELVGEEGEDWEFGEVDVAPGLAVRHKPPSQQLMARLNRSVFAGHTHRQAIRAVTTFDGGRGVVRTLVETGCLARIDKGLGYAPDADWQQGFATAAVHQDGGLSFDLATWRDGALTWRGERWSK